MAANRGAAIGPQTDSAPETEKLKSLMAHETLSTDQLMRGLLPSVLYIKQCEGKELFTCKLCGVTFTNNFDMYVHTRMHDGECTLRVLNEHRLLNQNSVNGSKQIFGRPYECIICGKKYKLPKSLLNHVMFAHKTDEECPVARVPYELLPPNFLEQKRANDHSLSDVDEENESALAPKTLSIDDMTIPREIVMPPIKLANLSLPRQPPFLSEQYHPLHANSTIIQPPVRIPTRNSHGEPPQASIAHGCQRSLLAPYLNYLVENDNMPVTNYENANNYPINVTHCEYSNTDEITVSKRQAHRQDQTLESLHTSDIDSRGVPKSIPLYAYAGRYPPTFSSTPQSRPIPSSQNEMIQRQHQDIMPRSVITDNQFVTSRPAVDPHLENRQNGIQDPGIWNDECRMGEHEDVSLSPPASLLQLDLERQFLIELHFAKLQLRRKYTHLGLSSARIGGCGIKSQLNRERLTHGAGLHEAPWLHNSSKRFSMTGETSMSVGRIEKDAFLDKFGYDTSLTSKSQRTFDLDDPMDKFDIHFGIGGNSFCPAVNFNPITINSNGNPSMASSLQLPTQSTLDYSVPSIQSAPKESVSLRKSDLDASGGQTLRGILAEIPSLSQAYHFTPEKQTQLQ